MALHGVTPIRQSDRSFGLMLGGALALIGTVGWLVFDALLIWVAAASAVLVLTAVAAPGLLLPLNRIWSALALRLSRVSNFVLLGLFFFLFVVPTALVLRLFGRDAMNRRPDASAESYWSAVDRQATAETFRDMF